MAQAKVTVMRPILILTLPKLALGAMLASLVLLPDDALAQRYSGGRPGQAMGGMPGSIESSRRPPPSALPGLAARGNQEPIPADPNQNLGPTPALFDAINRGDLVAARDAVARGADPDARNVLGLTPLDASVDQGRNDIMFFLLSVRGGRPSGPPPEDSSRSAFRSQPAVPTRTERLPRATATTVAPRGQSPAPAVSNAPRLWAGNGGVARPEVGFLGFDAGRPAGAAPVAAEPPASRRSRG